MRRKSVCPTQKKRKKKENVLATEKMHLGTIRKLKRAGDEWGTSSQAEYAVIPASKEEGSPGERGWGKRDRTSS